MARSSTNSTVGADPQDTTLAYGFDEDGNDASAQAWASILGDGPAVSTAKDVGKFMLALFKQQSLIGTRLLDQMRTGSEHDQGYGLGMGIDGDDWGDWYGHAGSYGGYEADVRYYPASNTYVHRTLPFLCFLISNNENSSFNPSSFNEYSDLNDVLDKYADYSLVLVDTAGMNPRDRNLERQLLMMKRARANLKKLLVLPCTSQRQVLKTVFDVYSQVRLDGCVLSKLDESASLGEAISIVIEEKLPVVYVADGQRIPDDIQPARAHNLISRAVYTAEQYSHIYSSLKYGS